MSVPSYKAFNAKTDDEEFIARVFTDPTFMSKCLGILEGNQSIRSKEIASIAKEYYLTFSEVEHYLRHNKLNTTYLPPARTAWLEYGLDTVSITFKSNATLNEVKELATHYFKHRHSLLRLLGRNLPPDRRRSHRKNMALIYAIFRLYEVEGMKLRDVFDLYEKGKLPLYNGPFEYSTYSLFKNYYLTNSPKIPHS